MKYILIALLVSNSLMAGAHTPSTRRTRISDNERTLSIQIDGERNGHKIHVNQSFDVIGMSPLRKEVIKYRVFASEGLLVPLHELPWLLTSCLAFVTLGASLLVVRFQRRNVHRQRVSTV